MARKWLIFFRGIQSLLNLEHIGKGWSNYRRGVAWLLLAFFTAAFCLVVSPTAAQMPVVNLILQVKLDTTSSLRVKSDRTFSRDLITAQVPLVNSIHPDSSATHLVELGRELYAKKQFEQAAETWQRAAQAYETQGDVPKKAMALSYLSLAYQKLGKWSEAGTAIETSLSLLVKNRDTSDLNERNSYSFEENFAKEEVSLRQIQAQALNTRGHLELALGQSEKALSIWQQATKIYEQVGDEVGMTGSLINQAQAMEASGLYRRACKTLFEVFKLDNDCNLSKKDKNDLEKVLQVFQEQKDAQLKILGLKSLGNVLRLVGDLENSQKVLEQSWSVAKSIRSPQEISASLLSLGDTKRALYNRKRDIYDRTRLNRDRDSTIDIANKSLCYYHEAIKQAENISTAKNIQIQAKLNQLSLLLEYKKWLNTENLNVQKVKNELSEAHIKIKPLVDELLRDQSWFFSLPPINTIYTRLNFAQILFKLPEDKEQYMPIAIKHAKDALRLAKGFGNQRAEADALGILGKLYEQTKEVSLAQKFTEEALRLAQSIQAWDIVYQWQWQLGRIYEASSKTEEAISFYDAAVTTLDSTSQDLLAINADVQFSFGDNVKPIYQNFIELLFKSEIEEQKKLEKIIAVNELLQQAELQNFLQCSKLDLMSLNDVENKPAGVIYTIVLDKQIEVIIQSSNKPLYHYQVNNLKDVENTVGQLRLSIENVNLWKLDPAQNLDLAQNLYKWLILPAKTALPESGTLVFVLDGFLQNIPMAVLHDGNQYLVEKYSVALTLGSRLRKPEPLPPEQIKALTAGLSENAPSFEKLPHLKLYRLPKVKDELRQLRKANISRQELLNQAFTKESLENQINASNFPVVHLATHGLFSSDPEQTVIFAYDNPINIKELDGFLRRRSQGSLDTIELLVLSACQTAKGDKRAALGIAGVAVQAGARSILATLWSVDDSSTAELIDWFYEALKSGNKTKAEALRYAQQKYLLENPKSFPYSWAAFILAGSWL